MSSYGERDGDTGPLVEREGVNAGGPVDRGPSPGDESGSAEAAGLDSTGEGPADGRPKDEEGQGRGEILSRPGSDNGLTRSGPGQEVSAGEG